MRSSDEVSYAIKKYADTLRRICMVYLKSYHDTEDIFQNVFMKYALSTAVFESEEHEKAWFIRVTVNECKDLLKSFFRRAVPLDEAIPAPEAFDSEKRDVLEAVLSLPKKNREVVYLHFFEGYTAPEIAKILGKNQNTVYTLITRSRKMLRERLGGDDDEE